MLRRFCFVLWSLVLGPAVGLAHYPWFMPGPSAANKSVHFVFEEGLSFGDGEYLDPFIKNASFWLRTVDNPAPSALKFAEVSKDGKRWLSLAVETPAPRAIDCYCKWGVYRGQLLHYYARHVDAASADDLAVLARAEKLRLDLVPAVKNGAVEIQLLWQDKPSAGKNVLIAGPQFGSKTLTTDARGIVRFEPARPGTYALRATIVEPGLTGTEDGKKYQGVRQTATLTIVLPIPPAVNSGK